MCFSQQFHTENHPKPITNLPNGQIECEATAAEWSERESHWQINYNETASVNEVTAGAARTFVKRDSEPVVSLLCKHICTAETSNKQNIRINKTNLMGRSVISLHFFVRPAGARMFRRKIHNLWAAGLFWVWWKFSILKDISDCCFILNFTSCSFVISSEKF